MKKQKTNSELIQFINVANEILFSEYKETKFALSIKKQAKVFQNALEKYNEDMEDARVEHCSVDERGNIIYNPDKSKVFSKDGLHALNKKARELIKQSVEVEIFIKEESFPENFKEEYREYFTEFINGEVLPE